MDCFGEYLRNVTEQPSMVTAVYNLDCQRLHTYYSDVVEYKETITLKQLPTLNSCCSLQHQYGKLLSHPRLKKQYGAIYTEGGQSPVFYMIVSVQN